MESDKRNPGRPRHIPTDFGRRLVVVLAGQAIPQSEIARVLDVDGKTLRRHYRRELDVGAARLECALALRLIDLAGGKSAVSLKATIFLLRCRFGWSRYLPLPSRRV